MIGILASEQDRTKLQAHIASIALDGKRRYKVSIAVWRKRRSVPQQKLYRWWLAYMKNERGEDPVALDVALKMKHLGVEPVEVMGTKVQMVPHSSDLDTKQFSEFLTNVHQTVLDYYEVDLPWPDDFGWDQFLAKYEEVK